jgi:hypothetical protein
MQFPLAWEIARLRKQWRALRAALKAVESAGKWLQAFQRSWPGRASEGMEEWPKIKERVGDVLDKVRDK